MDEPVACTVCGRRLRQIKHGVAHAGQVTWDAHVRTCPHNLGEHCYDGPRHDEWHQRERGWVRREVS
ncbi:MAG TPA: hypothetical protein VKX16_08540 [Chloroflexota bacterium]|nr:hypothetical protein [Chloroflexota bacterium]